MTRQYVYMGFSRCKILCSLAYMIAEKTIQFRHPEYNLDRAQKLISSSMSQHLSTRNISSKSMHAFLINLANRQTNECGQTHLPPPSSEVTIFVPKAGTLHLSNVMFKFNFLAVVVSEISGYNGAQRYEQFLQVGWLYPDRAWFSSLPSTSVSSVLMVLYR